MPVGTAGDLDREIIVAIVGPIGSPVDAAVDALTAGFVANGFTCDVVRVSRLIDTVVPALPDDDDASRYKRLMDKGDRLRAALGDEGACAYLATQV